MAALTGIGVQYMSTVTNLLPQRHVAPSAASPIAKPPATLSAEAKRFWFRLRSEHVIDDAASIEVLNELCAINDDIRRCAAAIKREGLTVLDIEKHKHVPHPLIRVQADLDGCGCRTFECCGSISPADRGSKLCTILKVRGFSLAM